MVAAPTYIMLRDATFRSFMYVGEEIMRGRIARSSQGSGNMSCRINTFEPDRIPSSGQADVVFRTASDPERMRGPNLSGLWLDEASIMVKEALDISMATLREGGEMGWVNMTFTPKGRQHWTFGEFFDKDGRLRKYSEIFHSKQSDNPMLAAQFVEVMREQYGEGKLAAQELDGDFIDVEGLMFNAEWFRKTVTEVPFAGTRIRYWDKAGTQDSGCFTVGALICRGEDGIFYIEDIVRGQWSYGTRNNMIKATAISDALKYDNRVTIWIEREPGSGGLESAQISVKELAGFPVYLDTPQGDKAERALAMSAQSQAGNVVLKEAEWNTKWVEEFTAFPEGKFKDQVDATCGGFNKLCLNGFRRSGVEGSVLAYPPAPDKLVELRQQLQIVNQAGFPINSQRGQETSDLLKFLVRRR